MTQARSIPRSPKPLAREAAQNAWTIAWRRLGSLREPDRIRSWLVAICANESRQLIGHRKRRQVIELSDTPQTTGTGDPADSIDLVDLEHALARLKPDDRGLLAMRYVSGLDSTDIAAQLGMSASGVRSRDELLAERRAEAE